jgi:UDP-N-acetylmuramyl pentapeptide phosphotransferase/UDP-N-acetylglucosamine-1-phosphate transferase
LGLLAGAFGLLGIERGAWPVWFPVAAFLPFVLDASFTVALRTARGQRFWQAHREHAYQRLSLGPLGRRRTLGAYALLMALCAGVALAALAAPDHVAAPAALAAVLAGLYALACRRRRGEVGAPPERIGR